MTKTSRLAAAALFATTLLLSGAASAQGETGLDASAPAAGDPGAASSWVGQTVVGADGIERGTVRSVTATGGSTLQPGLLVVEEAGGTEVELPLAGATSDGERVTLAAPTDAPEE